MYFSVQVSAYESVSGREFVHRVASMLRDDFEDAQEVRPSAVDDSDDAPDFPDILQPFAWPEEQVDTPPCGVSVRSARRRHPLTRDVSRRVGQRNANAHALLRKYLDVWRRIVKQRVALRLLGTAVVGSCTVAV